MTRKREPGKTKLAAGLIGAVISNASLAQQAELTFNIPPQPAASAIIAFGEQADVTVLLDHSLRDVAVQGVQGSYKIEEAIQLLLKDSELTYQIKNNSIIVTPTPQKSLQPDQHTKNRTKGSFFSAFVSAFIAALSPGMVAAERVSAGDTGNLVLEEIMVTASKRGETSLQNTPISVSAISADIIDKARVQNLEDMQFFAPNLVVADSSVSPGDGVVSIRGIGAQILSVGSDPSTSVHVDGVYNSRPATVFTEFLDVERVEVLRGPQGTLYGRNSVGGTINVIHKMPTAEPSVAISGEVGNLDSFRTEVALNGALAEDSLFGRLAFSHRKNGGWLNNLVDGGSIGDQSVTAMRTAARWLINEKADLLLRFDYSQMSGDSRPGKLLEVGDDPDDIPPSFGATLPPISANPDGSDWYDVNVNGDPYRNQDDWGLSALLTWEIGDYTLSSLSAHRSHDSKFVNDTDLLSVEILQDTISSKSEQISEELRLLSRYDGAINFQLSAFYMREEADLDIYSDFNPGNTEAGGAFLGIGTSELIVPLIQNNITDAYALFGEVYFDITERLRLTLGGRYSYEEKTLTDRTVPGFVVVPTGEIPSYTLDRVKETRDWDAFTPKLTLEYKPGDDILLYAAYSEGFKSGGFNLRYGTATADPFEPESVESVEIGAKATWLDGRLRTNIAIFRADYTDQQIQIVTNTEESSSVTQVETLTAGESRYQGIEFESQLLLGRSLKLGAAIGYLDAEFKKFFTVSTGDIAGYTPAGAPEWTVSAFGEYTLPVNDRDEIVFYLAGSWRDDNVQTPSALSTNQNIIEAYFLANARVAYLGDGGRWSVSLWGNNLFDEEYALTKDNHPLGLSLTYQGMSRTFGVSASVNF